MTTLTLPHQPADLHALNALPRFWVDTPTALASLVDEIDQTDIIALDTEFIKRSTYYPILALIQVNTGKAVYLIDAPRLDLGEFWQALTEVPVMVWYACGEDLGIFYLLSGCPPLDNVFDVQIGISYLSGCLQMGYSQAVNEILGVALDKGESQSDWLVRPLSGNQERYADHDVRYLLALYGVVKDALDKKGILAFAQEDSLLYAKELHTNEHLSDDERYLELLAPNYTTEQIAILQAITAWREALARAKNEPRTFIISKQALRDIILTKPITIKALAQTTINRKSLRLYGQEIIHLIKQVKSLPPEEHPPLPPPTYTSKNKPFKNALEKAIDTQSQRLGIPKNLLIKGRWINELLYLVYQGVSLDDLPDGTLSDGLMGYRRDWVVQTVLPLLYEYRQHILSGFDAPP